MAGNTITPSQRGKLRHRADDRCEICGRLANNAHHRKNRSQGGTDDLSNLLLLCGSGTTGCHGYVTTLFKNSPLHPANPKEMGWACWRSDDPASKPVLYRGQWALLDDEGNVTILRRGIPNVQYPSSFREGRNEPARARQFRSSDTGRGWGRNVSHPLF